MSPEGPRQRCGAPLPWRRGVKKSPDGWLSMAAALCTQREMTCVDLEPHTSLHACSKLHCTLAPHVAQSLCVVKTMLSGEDSTFLSQTQGESVRLHTGLAQMGLTSSPATCPAQMVPLHVPLDHAYMTTTTHLPLPTTVSIRTALPHMCAEVDPQVKLQTTAITDKL